MTIIMFEQLSEEEVKKVTYFVLRLIKFKDTIHIAYDLGGAVNMNEVEKMSKFIKKAKLTNEQQQILFGDVV